MQFSNGSGASSGTEPTDEGRQGFVSLMGSGDERRQYDGETVLIVFVEFHPFSEAGALEVTCRQGWVTYIWCFWWKNLRTSVQDSNERA